MLIKNVRIENFKRFDHLDLDLGSLDCLVGPNNSGKTTLLQALALFDFCVHHSLGKKNGELEFKSRNIPPEEFYVLPVSNPVDLWTDRKTQSRSKLAKEKRKKITITLTFDEGMPTLATVDLTYNLFNVAIHCEDTSQEWLARLRDLRMHYLPVFSMFLPQEERRTPAVIADSLARGRVNSVIRNLLLDLKQEKRDHELVEILRRTFPSLVDLTISFDEVNDRYISVTYKEKGRPKEFDVFSAGSGFQQFVYLFGFIALRQPSVILLDEPDVHLHGSLQRVLRDELNRLVHAGKQVLFATHSRELIERMSPEEILSLEAGGAKRLTVAFDVYDTLDRLGVLDSTQLPVVQAFRRVLVVEDRSDHELLSVFCSKCLGASIWPEVDRRLAVCYSKGNPWKQDMPRLLHQLTQMIAVKGQSLKMFIVADRDYHPDPPFLLQSLNQKNLQWHVWERVEIENYLLSQDGLQRLVGERTHEPTFDQSALAQEFARLLDSSKDVANDRLVKTFQEYGKSRHENWDPATWSKKAREYLQKHWETEKLALADAKDIVLPGMKLWLQNQHLGQFSDKALAEALLPEDLPKEVHDLAKELAVFAGVEVTKKR
jgi:ABC-type cobalamin/Fe3+-siderophores transport system ATPase subunit